MTAELLEIARSVAVQAGALARLRRSEGVEIAASKSSTEDIVTFADRETEALIRSRLAELRPHDGFFGEESDAETGTSGLTWVVDPIDGTVNFLYGIPHYAVSIAVVEGDPDPLTWRALAGVVANPASGETFSAQAGAGAFLGASPIRVAPPVELSQALVGTGFSYLADIRSEQAEVLSGLLHRVRDIRRMGAASLDLCAIACGRLDAYFERGLGPWDHAAGALIAREAGARVTGRDGAPPSREFVLAAEPALAAGLERLFAEL
ncbi:inositol monophosphatase [Glaciihabitans sp. INWT7]|uniref:inositol monophosphatase family protein n=1 Tax=Glaciihabitans sp. INWT7 TaxID=2596912 RepID=UPI001628F0AD|nr:inositol monophosphatase family protein [Glaciihabitans sp. INWT7]QNE45719.1 inositol monophosphatase [Glaciihabitans sp. INWT7]